MLAELPRRLAGRLRALGRRSDRPAQRATDIAAALEFCRRVLPRRAILFLISDFLDGGYLDALSHANRKHDAVAVQVVDARERQLRSGGLVTLEDAETGARRLVDTGSAAFRSAMSQGAEERAEDLARSLRAMGVDLVRIDPAQSVVEPLLRFLRMREKRTRR